MITKCSLTTGSIAKIPLWGPTLYPWVGPQSGIFYIAAHLVAHLATVVHFRRRRPWHPPPVTHNSHYFSPTPSDLSNAVTQGTPQRPIRLAAECGTGCVARVSETKPRSLRHRKKHNIVARANGGELRIRTTPRWLRLGHPECAHVAPVHMVCRMLTVSVALQKRCPSRPFFDETVYRISWIYCDIATSAALPHCHLRHPSEPQFDELWHASLTPKKR